MYYKIVDIKKAIYEVDDLQSAIINVAQTQLKEVFGRMTFQECMTSQDKINEYVITTAGMTIQIYEGRLPSPFLGLGHSSGTHGIVGYDSSLLYARFLEKGSLQLLVMR